MSSNINLVWRFRDLLIISFRLYWRLPDPPCGILLSQNYGFTEIVSKIKVGLDASRRSLL